MTTYAAFYNVHEGMKAQSIIESRRSSEASAQKARKSSFQSAMDNLRPAEEAQTPTGIYTPVIKRGSLFSGLQLTEAPQTPTGIYTPLIKRGPLFSFRKGKKSSSSSN